MEAVMTDRRDVLTDLELDLMISRIRAELPARTPPHTSQEADVDISGDPLALDAMLDRPVGERLLDPATRWGHHDSLDVMFDRAAREDR
jgi:hypothetical protein